MWTSFSCSIWGRVLFCSSASGFIMIGVMGIFTMRSVQKSFTTASNAVKSTSAPILAKNAIALSAALPMVD
jgi:hypothetical protein